MQDARSKTMKICVAGQGAFGQKHLDALKRIPGAEVASLIGGNPAGTEQGAKKYGVSHWGNDLGEGIKRADAVILATPTKMHFKQAEQVMRAGKHVLVEIPVTDSVEDAENLVKIARETGVTAMAGRGRRAARRVRAEPRVTDSAEDGKTLVKTPRETSVTAMAGHVRRFNPSH